MQGITYARDVRHHGFLIETINVHICTRTCS